MVQTGYDDIYYARTLKDARAYLALDADIQADVCVIGGGLAGLNTALGLIERGQSVALVEMGRIGRAASGRNGGFVAKGFSAGEATLAKKLGEDQARNLIGLTKAARRMIRERIGTYDIDCGPLRDGVLTVSWRDRPEPMKETVLDMNRRFDMGLEFWDRDRVREHCHTTRYYDGIYSGQDFQFHPLNYVQGLARVITDKGGRIFENSKALSVEKHQGGWRVRTEGGVVDAKQVVLCCAIDVNGLDKRLARATFPVMTYIMVTKPLSAEALRESVNTTHAIYDMRFASDYYRVMHDNRILWGGRVSVGKDPAALSDIMLADLLKVYPQLSGRVEAEMSWSGRLSYAPHKMPQIGKLDDGYWYCTCFGGHGLVPTTVGGEIIASAIANNDTRHEWFKPFGLSYAGGKLGPYVAQSVYFWWRMRDYLGL